MSLATLLIATAGLLGTPAPASLQIATQGLLQTAIVPPTPIPDDGGGGGFDPRAYQTKPKKQKPKEQRKEPETVKLVQPDPSLAIEEDDEEIATILQIWLSIK